MFQCRKERRSSPCIIDKMSENTKDWGIKQRLSSSCRSSYFQSVCSPGEALTAASGLLILMSTKQKTKSTVHTVHMQLFFSNLQNQTMESELTYPLFDLYIPVYMIQPPTCG